MKSMRDVFSKLIAYETKYFLLLLDTKFDALCLNYLISSEVRMIEHVIVITRST